MHDSISYNAVSEWGPLILYIRRSPLEPGKLVSRVPHFPLNSEGIALSGVTQRRASPRYKSKEKKILNIKFPQVGIEHTQCPVSDSRTLVSQCHD